MTIKEYLSDKKEFFINELEKLVAIPSVRDTAKENAPFGENCAEILKAVAKLYRENGFKCDISDEGGWACAEYGDGEATVGLYSHGDVVPVGDDWTLTKPFEMLRKDGFLIGRGVSDNKCSVLISLLTAMAIRDLKLPFNGKLIMFTGSNEETGMRDLEHFAKNSQIPKFNIITDNDFPVCRGEKSIVRIWAKSPKISDSKITDISGGDAFNIILGKVSATVNGEKITEYGISKHAAEPDGSKNAALPLFLRLSENTDSRTAKILNYAARLVSKTDGSTFNISSNDKNFSDLTCANGMVRFENKRILLSFDIRFGPETEMDGVFEKINNTLSANGWEYECDEATKGYILPESFPLVKAVLDVWNECTGENGKSVLCGGGTYARLLPNAVSVGDKISKEPPFEVPDGHGHAHQPDEFISVDGVFEAAEIIIKMALKASQI